MFISLIHFYLYFFFFYCDFIFYCFNVAFVRINVFINFCIIIIMYSQENYTKYDGFVILHGTDTMGYTASALSFMLENLGKPVILTGSQVN